MIRKSMFAAMFLGCLDTKKREKICAGMIVDV